MFSLDTIRDMQAEAAVKAARQDRQPLVLWEAEEIRRAPDLGTYTPKGWRPLLWADINETGQGHAEYDDGQGRVLLFVDSSGMGDDDEPALNKSQLIARVGSIQATAAAKRLTIGWGIYEVGQFQCHLAAYAKSWSRGTLDRIVIDSGEGTN